MKFKNEELKVAADAIRVLVADMVEKANSGHPGGSMGQADVAATLWLEYLRARADTARRSSIPSSTSRAWTDSPWTR